MFIVKKIEYHFIIQYRLCVHYVGQITGSELCLSIHLISVSQFVCQTKILTTAIKIVFTLPHVDFFSEKAINRCGAAISRQWWY